MRISVSDTARWGLVLLLAASAGAQQATEGLQHGFQTPPDAAKPRVWWHWMSGNVTKEGITADLEWMHRTGIGGMQMFDGDLGVARYLEKPVIWMTPEWKDAFKFAGSEADRLGLEMSMAASGGWSETAGPWVKPDEAMKKVVWSETEVSGGRRFSGRLSEPPHVNGPFQGSRLVEFPNTPMVGGAPGIPRPKTPEPVPDPTFYKDTLVLAYRLPDTEKPANTRAAKMTSSSSLNVAMLQDHDYATTADLTVEPGATSAWIQWEFPESFSARSFTLGMAPPPSRQSAQLPVGDLSFSDDGTNWTKLMSLPDAPPYARPFSVRTFTFVPTKAKYFRVTMQQPVLTPEQVLRGLTPPKSFSIAEVSLSDSPRIAFYEDKASFGTFVGGADTTTPPVSAAEAVPTKDVVNLTGTMRADGSLDWDAPAGRWVILRMGYSLTGKKNHPATPEATGFEVDKLSAVHVTEYLRKYTGMISSTLGSEYGKSFRSFLMDSWEAGQENWTEEMLTEFTKRRGYDPTPYLPTLTGRIIGSSETSDAFLWDYRRTIAEMLADNHYKLAHDFLAKQGIGLYAEAMGIGLPTTGDGLLNKGQVTVPMGEFWTPLPGEFDVPTREADVRETASAAHIYGRSIAATESFTSVPTIPGWGQTPFYLKELADQNFARGINRIVFHTSDHQPFTDKKHLPGITLGYFGQHYSRNITWAEQAVAWNGYLARCSYMEQQGKPVVDVAYFYGEGAPVTVPYWKKFSPEVPDGFAYDYLNSDVLLNQSSASSGRLALKSGMEYRVLVVPDEFTKLTLPMLRKLGELIEAGAIVSAPRVTGSPSLADRDGAPKLQQLVKAIWGEQTGAKGSHAYGKGRIFWGTPLDEVMEHEKVDRDFSSDAPTDVVEYDYPSPKAATDVVWDHRRTVGEEIYFVANQRMRTETVAAHFRVEGKQVSLWHPETGAVESATVRTENGRSAVELHLAPEESVFVVFGVNAGIDAKPASKSTLDLLTLQGPWIVTFPPDLGAPDKIELPSLMSWTNVPDGGVKYFSGTATYSKDFTLDSGWQQGKSQVLLDLGRVREFAEVTLNGQKLPEILWKPPFTMDVTSALKTGANHLEVKITNLWPNRIIGDMQPDVKKRYTFTVYGAYKADSPLTESGLLGPVRLVRGTEN